MAKSVIYETRGRAREYCELAINLYDGCTHGCRYCYAPDVLHKDRAGFHGVVSQRLFESDLERAAAGWMADEKRPVLLCFSCDPYQPLEGSAKLTRAAIVALHRNGMRFTVLTKAGALAHRDFDLYGPGDSFAVTLTSLDDRLSEYWEPNAALPQERIANLIEAWARGIPTWVSLEPVIDPDESLAVIEATHKWVHHYKVGKLNYHAKAAETDWKKFAVAALDKLWNYGNGFQIKKDLGVFIGSAEGYREGRQLP